MRAQLTHTARPVTDSRAPCYPWPFSGQLPQVRCPGAVARPQFRDEAPPSLPRVLAARVPRLPRYYGALRFPGVRPAALRCLRATVTPPCACVRSAQARRRLGARGVRVRPPPGLLLSRERRRGVPSSWGTLPVPMPCSLTPAGPNTAGHYAASAWPPLASRRRLPRFGNFGAQSHGLGAGCLRFVRWVTHTRTQDSLLVAGQALPGGIRTRRVPTKGFQAVSVTSSPPFPSFLGAGCVPLILEAEAGGRCFIEPRQRLRHNKDQRQSH